MRTPLTRYARDQRANATEAEHRLWRQLRQRQCNGCRFRRQKPLGRYIVDFVCFEKNLVIEVDGGQHAETHAAYDAKRTAWLEQRGFRVLRFWNDEVLRNAEAVMEAIRLALESPSPCAPSRRGRGKK